jgi:hypothetical protein
MTTTNTNTPSTPFNNQAIKRKRRSPSSSPLSSDPDALYCHCQRTSAHGNLIQCSKKTCPIECYHEQCVDNGAPDTTGEWFCPACRLLRRDETQVRSEDVEEEREGGNREGDRGTDGEDGDGNTDREERTSGDAEEQTPGETEDVLTDRDAEGETDDEYVALEALKRS